MQTVTPFIHAHAFGLDSFKQHIFHLHTDEDEVANSNSVNGSLVQAHIGENQIIGVVTTVASGIKTSLADNIADGVAALAIYFTLALLIFDAPARFLVSSRKVLYPQHNVYSQQNPRAPPA